MRFIKVTILAPLDCNEDSSSKVIHEFSKRDSHFFAAENQFANEEDSVEGWASLNPG
jgi:hypothetical protein